MEDSLSIEGRGCERASRPVLGVDRAASGCRARRLTLRRVARKLSPRWCEAQSARGVVGQFAQFPAVCDEVVDLVNA